MIRQHYSTEYWKTLTKNPIAFPALSNFNSMNCKTAWSAENQ